MKDIKKVPPFTRVIAIAFAALVFIAVIRPLITGGTPPRFWPVLVGILSSALLYFVRPSESGSAGSMRVGFYVGLFAFFVAFPILYPDEIRPDIPDEIHWALGWALFLSILGFEMAYWIAGVMSKPAHRTLILLQPTWRQKRLLLSILGLGLAAWFFSVWDYSQTINAPISSVLLSMRGAIEGDALAKPGYLLLFMGSAIFLSAVAATVLLTLYRLSVRSILFCWATLIACALVGFLNGSRALFLYAFIPLAITGWKKLSGLRFMTSIRWPGAIAAGALVIAAWGTMAAMRGSDIRAYEGDLGDISVVESAQSALDIYSMTATVVETFPARIPYVQGESIVPLVLGWVPRTIWPSKPYPFGLYMNTVNGETIEARAASLAVGLTGEGYGNFGLFGAFLWCFFLGIACSHGDRLMLRFHPDDTLHLLIGGMSMVWVAMIVRGGVPEMFYMGLQIMVFPLLLASVLSASQKNEKIRITRMRTLRKFQQQNASYH